MIYWNFVLLILSFPFWFISSFMYFQVNSIIEIWAGNSKSVIGQLRQRSLAPKQVTRLNYCVIVFFHLQNCSSFCVFVFFFPSSSLLSFFRSLYLPIILFCCSFYFPLVPYYFLSIFLSFSFLSSPHSLSCIAFYNYFFHTNSFSVIPFVFFVPFFHLISPFVLDLFVLQLPSGHCLV